MQPVFVFLNPTIKEGASCRALSYPLGYSAHDAAKNQNQKNAICSKGTKLQRLFNSHSTRRWRVAIRCLVGLNAVVASLRITF